VRYKLSAFVDILFIQAKQNKIMATATLVKERKAASSLEKFDTAAREVLSDLRHSRSYSGKGGDNRYSIPDLERIRYGSTEKLRASIDYGHITKDDVRKLGAAEAHISRINAMTATKLAKAYLSEAKGAGKRTDIRETPKYRQITNNLYRAAIEYASLGDAKTLEKIKGKIEQAESKRKIGKGVGQEGLIDGFFRKLNKAAENKQKGLLYNAANDFAGASAYANMLAYRKVSDRALQESQELRKEADFKMGLLQKFRGAK